MAALGKSPPAYLDVNGLILSGLNLTFRSPNLLFTLVHLAGSGSEHPDGAIGVPLHCRRFGLDNI